MPTWLDACYFTGNSAGVALIVDVPDQETVSAMLFTIQASGGGVQGFTVTPLLTAEQMDAAMPKSPANTPPGS